ncbi:MAG TPA: thioredoxin-like domain-containing protein [Gemmatales bacterium]|nr:thioredoxin-like domain-containing protein [Gemmatales bacterium]
MSQRMVVSASSPHRWWLPGILILAGLAVILGTLSVEAAAPQDRAVQKAPELEGGIAWLNTSGPLKMADMRGKVVLLDFWTFCCINCIHILPDLERLEKKYPNELVVIGVHSAKFNAEKDTGNIREAVLRYHIEHPVVNDAEHKIWNAYGVNSWPTFWLIDPEGNVVGQTSSEGQYDLLDKVIGKLIESHRQKKTLNTKPIRVSLERDKIMTQGNMSPLLYPGKVHADPTHNRLFIADSSNHRIVITDLDGKKLDVAGKGTSGNTVGSFDQAQFNDPQGMALLGDTLFVADRKNHQIKALDLKQRQLRAVAGTGMQTHDRRGGPALQTGLNSPWDILLLKEKLYIAMAGHHQIWQLDLDRNQLSPFAGNGREDIIDGSLAQSSFAQPSGLASDGSTLYVADSEVSAVRAVSLGNTEEVKSLVGSGLFNFGDKDGTAANVLLQHCLGVAMWQGNVMIADTYNNKIKLLEPKTRQVLTYAGDGTPGNSDQPARFNEPAGIHVVGDKAYVADTNNHLVRVIDLKKRSVQTLKISGLTPPAPATPKPSFRNVINVALEPKVLPVTGDVELEFKIVLPAGLKIDASSPISYLVEGLDDQKKAVHETFGELFGSKKLKVPVQKLTNARKLKVSIEYYPCTEGQGLCQVKSQSWEIPVTFTAQGSSNLKLETRGQ